VLILCSICCQEQQVTTNRLARVGESICELPQARVFRQHQPKHTTVQIRWVPQFASPNFRSRAIRRSTRATLLVCHSVRAQDQQQFPYTAKHHRDSAAQSSIPSYCNFTEVPAALVLVQTGQSGAGSGGQAGRRTAYPQYLLENLGARQVRCQGGAHAWCPRRKLKLTRQTTRL